MVRTMKPFLVLVLLLAGRCLAASYYVSPTGLDTNNGTSTATPWLTLAHVNAHTFVGRRCDLSAKRGNVERAVDSAIVGDEWESDFV